MQKHPKTRHVLLLSFVFSPNIGGVESHLDDLCEYLSHKNYKITVITYQPIITKGWAPFKEEKKNLTIFRLPQLKFNLFNKLERFPILEILYLVPLVFIFSTAFIIYTRKRVDVVQAHGFNMAIVAYLLKKIFKKKTVINTHVSFSFPQKTFYTKMLFKVLSSADFVLVLTEGAKKELEKIGLVKEKIIVYHQWIDTRLFNEKNKRESRIKLNLPLQKFVVFFAGRLVPAKGVQMLLQASRKVSSDILFVFVGSGPLEQEIKKMTEKSKSVFFAGKVPKEDLPYYYSAANICIIPSFQATSTYAEGIPRVLIEALTCGTPVVATNTGGVGELLHEKVGFYIQPTVRSIVSTIHILSKKETLLEKMSSDCHEYAASVFGKLKNAKIIEKSLSL